MLEGVGLESIVDALDRYGAKGVFFFRPELLITQDDLVRRIVGSGHCIGLLAEGEDAAVQLERGNELLGRIARTAATAAYAADELRTELESADWRCWDETFNAVPRGQERPAGYAQRILNAIGTRNRSVYLTLDDSDATANVLETALQRFEEQEYTIVTPIETRF